MSSLLKLMPLMALGYVGYSNSDAILKSLDLIETVKVEATVGIEMSSIAQVVAHEYVESNTIPLDNFPEFLRANLKEAGGKQTRDHARDMWGTLYRIARSTPNGFEIQCAGPDKKWGTTDDLRLVHSLDQYGGVGEAGVTPVQPAGPATQAATVATTHPPAQTGDSPASALAPASQNDGASAPPSAPPSANPSPSPTPSSFPPPPKLDKKPYQWKRG
ncbi:MAG: hypothetical protein HY360_15875 [Verrucomicrobia bacterium]|nr:hypothetical protein [Verrucomicrobiota bacterium]